ncbi:MAG: UDP-N-acetyl-D-galactosamine dehydrogenase, partial [Pseudomonadota bacterium]
MLSNVTLAVIGVGYVGLPLVIEFGKHFKTIGFDVSREKIEKCRSGQDPSHEISDADMALAIHAEYSF